MPIFVYKDRGFFQKLRKRKCMTTKNQNLILVYLKKNNEFQKYKNCKKYLITQANLCTCGHKHPTNSNKPDSTCH